jgi:hypothetical protein
MHMETSKLVVKGLIQINCKEKVEYVFGFHLPWVGSHIFWTMIIERMLCTYTFVLEWERKEKERKLPVFRSSNLNFFLNFFLSLYLPCPTLSTSIFICDATYTKSTRRIKVHCFRTSKLHNVWQVSPKTDKHLNWFLKDWFDFSFYRAKFFTHTYD